MKKCTLLLIALFIAVSSFTQNSTSVDDSPHTLLTPPAFPGGESALLQFLSTNIVYPQLAVRRNTQGTVVVAFTVGSDGKISDIEVVKDLGDGCAAEAVRVVGEMPDWDPGRDERGPVKVRYALPVRFQLTGSVPPTKKPFRDRSTLFGN